MAYKTPEEDLVVFADNAFARMEKDGKTKLRPDSDVLLISLLCTRQGGWMHSNVVNELVYLFNKRQRQLEGASRKFPLGRTSERDSHVQCAGMAARPKESAELYPLVWNGMHVQPCPSTQTIKQQTLVYAECTSDSEFKGKFAPDLVGKNSVPSLMTSLLNKANRYFSKNVRGKAHQLCMKWLRKCDRYRDDRGGYCNTKAFESCLIAYFRWFKKVTGHARIQETSFSYNELTFVTLEVLKVLNDDVAKSGVHANQIHSENKATCSSLSAEYDQIFGQTENEPKFGLATTVSQA
ncbi:TPA: hypothetical protein ACH3X1_001171 [Trebouxia sp. C0004]